MTENALVAEAVARHEKQLQRYSTRLVRDANLAADVVQEAFGRLRSTEPPPKNLRAWLYRVARNFSLDLLRKQSMCEPLENPQWLAADACSSNPLALAQKNEEYAMLMREMNALPTRQREAVRLKFQEGLSYAEIADVTGETKSNVGWLLHSAIKSLREKLVK
ncbi:unnamed protein product [marine sediment metagenome]|uniref:RNA polymerase sigma-70 region 2 domain-containing protein n=1 Tax=marine sediment metagenome TaxID=412755 RepID=X0T9R0_9ZZZZ